jgi:hypothetical protein
MTDEKTTVDWAGIERDYTQTNRSIREIAGWFQISDTAIRKRARAEGWKRPEKATGSHLQTTANLPAIEAPKEPPKVEEVLGRGRNLIDRLLDELDAETLHKGEMEVIIQMSETDPARLNALRQAVSLPVRAKTLQTLALALKTMGETVAEAPKGKKASKQAAAEELAEPGNKFAPRRGPRLAVSNP